MGSSEPVKVSKKQIEDAHIVWNGFMTYGRWSVYVICITLILLGLVFIDW